MRARKEVEEDSEGGRERGGGNIYIYRERLGEVENVCVCVCVCVCEW